MFKFNLRSRQIAPAIWQIHSCGTLYGCFINKTFFYKHQDLKWVCWLFLSPWIMSRIDFTHSSSLTLGGFLLFLLKGSLWSQTTSSYELESISTFSLLEAQMIIFCLMNYMDPGISWVVIIRANSSSSSSPTQKLTAAVTPQRKKLSKLKTNSSLGPIR